MGDFAYRYQADIQWVYATGGYGSIFDDQPTVILLILSGCFEFFLRQVCIVIGVDFHRNMHIPVQKWVRRLLT